MSICGVKTQEAICSQEREVQVIEPLEYPMSESTGGLSKGMIRFINTPIAEPFARARTLGFASSAGISALIWGVLSAFTGSIAIAFSVAVVSFLVNAVFVLNRYLGHASTPLAVNLNHPFMDQAPLGKAEVKVQLSNGSWIDPGSHRVKLIPDELFGGFNIVHDTLDFPVLGHFSEAKKRTPLITRHMALINQSIALRDAVNDVPDPIDEAREREKKESGLLERSWLEEEKEIEVESPLVSFFKREE